MDIHLFDLKIIKLDNKSMYKFGRHRIHSDRSDGGKRQASRCELRHRIFACHCAQRVACNLPDRFDFVYIRVPFIYTCIYS